MNYLDAFGGFDPQNDPDAAIKIVLNSLLMDKRVEELRQLLTEGDEVGALAGEPGWVLQRRDEGSSGKMPGYAAWPNEARFRAFVDPAVYHLGHPEYYMDRAEFQNYVDRAVRAYAASQHSDK